MRRAILLISLWSYIPMQKTALAMSLLASLFSFGSVKAATTVEDLWFIQAYPIGLFKKPAVLLSPMEQNFYHELEERLKESPLGAELLRTAKHLGFQFAGFTGSSSKANTDPQARLVRIR